MISYILKCSCYTLNKHEANSSRCFHVAQLLGHNFELGAFSQFEDGLLTTVHSAGGAYPNISSVTFSSDCLLVMWPLIKKEMS